MEAWLSASEKMATGAEVAVVAEVDAAAGRAQRAATTARLAEKPVGNSRHSSVPLSCASPASSSRCCEREGVGLG